MTENKLKEILNIKEWSEIKRPEQFLTFLNYFYELAPGVKAKILPKLVDINGLVDDFRAYCAEGIVDYEPSVMVAMSKYVDRIKNAVGKTNSIRGPEKRVTVANLYSDFSEWFGLNGEVQCSLDDSEFVCNIASAIEMTHDNEVSDEKLDLSMMLLTRERERIIESQSAKALENIDINMDFLAELLGEEAGIELDEMKQKKYLM